MGKESELVLAEIYDLTRARTGLASLWLCSRLLTRFERSHDADGFLTYTTGYGDHMLRRFK